jgi:hypothetical protein
MHSLLSTPFVEPITCQPWCEEGDGHPRESVREDQCCYGVEHRVLLSTEPTMLMSDGRCEQQHLNTHLIRQADDTVTRVFIGHDDGFGKSATFEEARRFANEILSSVNHFEA